MSEHDFQVHQRLSNEGATGFPVTASQTFLAGEPVTLVAAGTLSEASDDPAAITGIAAHRATDRANASFPVGQRITVYGIANTVFKTKNFATAGAGAAVVPTLANIGDLAGLTLSGGAWSLDTGTNNLIAEVTGILDAKGFSLSDPNLSVGVGVTVLFKLI